MMGQIFMDTQQTPPEEFQGRLAAGKDWTEIVAWVGDLPPLPHVASKAMVMVEDPDTTAGKLSDLLGTDTALAARVLKIANSAMFACQREITTLNQAIMIIGFKALKGIIVAATLRQLNRKFGKLEKMIWENSTSTAVGAHFVAQHLKKHYVDEAFLLGLLHDLGKLVLMRQIPDEYTEVTKITQSAGRPYFEVEQEKLGFAHPLIGALVAKKWNFSPETCQVILHHHDPIEAAPENELEEKTLVIQLGNAISHCMGFGHGEGYPDLQEAVYEYAGKLGISQEDTDKMQEEIKELFEQQQSVFD